MNFAIVWFVYCPAKHDAKPISLQIPNLGAIPLGPRGQSISFPPVAILCPECKKVSIHFEAHHQSQAPMGSKREEARLVRVECDDSKCRSGIDVFVPAETHESAAIPSAWTFAASVKCAEGHSVLRPARILA
jgi:hypothetical protein